MSNEVETWSQRLIGHRPLSRFIQIDRLVMAITATGTHTSASFYLPHGRYTVFVDADPSRAARSFELENDEEYRISDDWRWVPQSIANVPVPLVQRELPRGNYRLTIEMDPQTSSWTAQVVLNSMMSWEAPPKAWRSSLALPESIRLRSGGDPTFRISRTGHYDMDFQIGGFRIDEPVTVERLCDFHLKLVAADRHAIEWRSDSHWPNGAFFGAGIWSVEMDTDCEWELIIKPRVGPSGGGARWF